jgi:hypothetical protein
MANAKISQNYMDKISIRPKLEEISTPEFTQADGPGQDWQMLSGPGAASYASTRERASGLSDHLW